MKGWDTRKYWKNENYHQEKDKENNEYTEEGNDTQDMHMDHTEEEIILNDDEDKNDDVIDEEEVDCAGVRWLSGESRPM